MSDHVDDCLDSARHHLNRASDFNASGNDGDVHKHLDAAADIIDKLRGRAPAPIPVQFGAELLPVRPPITISFYWGDDGQTLITLVDDGEPQPVAWYLDTGRLHSIDGRDLTDVYCKLAAPGAIQEWRRVRATP